MNAPFKKAGLYIYTKVMTKLGQIYFDDHIL